MRDFPMQTSLIYYFLDQESNQQSLFVREHLSPCINKICFRQVPPDSALLQSQIE